MLRKWTIFKLIVQKYFFNWLPIIWMRKHPGHRREEWRDGRMGSMLYGSWGPGFEAGQSDSATGALNVSRSLLIRNTQNSKKSFWVLYTSTHIHTHTSLYMWLCYYTYIHAPFINMCTSIFTHVYITLIWIYTHYIYNHAPANSDICIC